MSSTNSNHRSASQVGDGASGTPELSLAGPSLATLINWHGQQVRNHGIDNSSRVQKWPLPRVIAKTNKDARPGYYTCNASEYLEASPEVEMLKIKIVADMIRQVQYPEIQARYHGNNINYIGSNSISNLNTATGPGTVTGTAVSGNRTKTSLKGTTSSKGPNTNTNSKVNKPQSQALMTDDNDTILGSCIIYSGAGLSTAAGIPDYASKNNEKSSIIQSQQQKGSALTSHQKLNLQPTLGHHALSLMAHRGFFHHWVNQNHDRLGQKAGFPDENMNEIHGAWNDRLNPVVKMSGSLRQDLWRWMEAWSEKADLVLACGTSLSGMASDSYIPMSAVKRQDRKEFQMRMRMMEKDKENQPSGTSGLLSSNTNSTNYSSDNYSEDTYPEYRYSGLIIIGLQQTRMDHMAAIKIWGKLDDILPKIAQELLMPMGNNNSNSNNISTNNNMHMSIRLPDPTLVKIGQKWQRDHPSCNRATPMRPGYKSETVDEILKRANPAEWKKNNGLKGK